MHLHCEIDTKLWEPGVEFYSLDLECSNKGPYVRGLLLSSALFSVGGDFERWKPRGRS
jgi:hypothetical protein